MSQEGKPLVLVTHTLPESWLNPLKKQCRLLIGPEDAIELSSNLAENLHSVEGLFTLLTIPVDKALLDRAPHLRVVSNMAVGVDNIDVKACTARGIPVGNTPGVLTEGTADLTMALLLAIARKLPEASQDASRGKWTTWSPTGWLGADLDGARLGIIGFGKIGQAVAARAIGFGLEIVYHDTQEHPDLDRRLGASFLSLDELLSTSDYISLHVPLTEKTRGMIDTVALRAMKSSAILVNTSRGPVVETQALLPALQEGWISAAALDVTDPEPLTPDHPLYALPNCLITPHIGSATWKTRRSMAKLAVDNLLAGLSGKRLPHCANPEVYERA